MAKRKSQTAAKNDGASPVVGSRIMAGLTRALDWFDNSLQNVVASLGYEPFHRTQSMIIMHIALGIDRPSDIAREMRLTRQNVHQMARVLIEKGVIESLPDPTDPRRSMYRLSEQASDLRRTALATITQLEQVLERRIGTGRVSGLRDALAADWGPDVADASELGELRQNKTTTAGRNRHRSTLPAGTAGSRRSK